MARLLLWARRKRAGATTVALMREAGDDADREMVAVVALLDVDEATLVEAMGDIDLEDHDALCCRRVLEHHLAAENARFATAWPGA